MSTQITQTRKFWNTGDTITADKLTQMGVLAYVTVDENDEFTLDITWQEAYDGMVTGVVERFNDNAQTGYSIEPVHRIYKNKNPESYVIATDNLDLVCSSANGYPTTANQASPNPK